MECFALNGNSSPVESRVGGERDTNLTPGTLLARSLPPAPAQALLGIASLLLSEMAVLEENKAHPVLAVREGPCFQQGFQQHLEIGSWLPYHGKLRSGFTSSDLAAHTVGCNDKVMGTQSLCSSSDLHVWRQTAWTCG